MKRLIPVSLIALLLLPGCTTRITSPDGWSYENAGFDKKIGKLHIERRADGTTVVDLENYTAESRTAENIGKALDLGMAVAGQAVKP